MPQIYGIVRTNIPAEDADGVSRQVLVDEFGSQIVKEELFALTELGSLFRACNATFGTGVAMGIQTSFSDTANVLFLMRNGSATKKIIPRYINLLCTAAGASTTSSRLAIVLDTANRYSSGGTDLSGNIVNANSGKAPTSAIDVLRYNCTASAAVAKRQVANIQLKTQAAPCWVVGDSVFINFGALNDLGAISGTAANRLTCGVAPVVLEGQNHCMLIHMWNPANATTAPSWEFELAWLEK
jgi:hypothetical protein